MEAEAAQLDRLNSHHNASVPAPHPASDVDAGTSKPNIWSQAAVGLGALALVGVFVAATVGLDLGMGGRRGSKQPTSQVC